MDSIGASFIGGIATGFFAGIYVGYILTRDYFRKENYWKADEARNTLKSYLKFQDYQRERHIKDNSPTK